jgi:hypothetical protein
MSTASPVQFEIVRADPELQKVLDVARHIGAATNDDVNTSYTSLFIGMMWSDDPTSQWLQGKLDGLGARKSAVYAARKIDESQRAPILAKVGSGEAAAPRRDPVSISARTVLEEARSLATETGRAETDPLGTRHVAGVYFFRNPPGHNAQFHAEWGFEKEAWRREFAQFIASTYPDEAPAWSQVLVGYVPSNVDADQVLGTVLGDFRLDPQALGVLRALENATSNPPVMRSEVLLELLVKAREVADCAAFADLAADRLGMKGTISLPAQAEPFQGRGSSYPLSRGTKNVLDGARSMARSTTGTETIGVRHLIASILVDPDSTAHKRLVGSGLSLPLLREKLLKVFSRRWLDDDGSYWQLLMVGSSLPNVATIHPDSADRGEDRLDVTRYARAFASVIAADRVEPPFSVGIFGDWGSGKSFFMRLMSDQTKRLSAFADKGEDGKRLFCERVVSIRFNAWHYAEGQLLASLVQTILEGLRTAIVGEHEESELMDAVLSKLELAKVARGEAEARLEAAREEREESRTGLEQARAETESRARHVQDVQSTDVMAAVRDVFLPQKDVDQAIVVAEQYLGLTGLEELKEKGDTTAGEVMAVVDDARVTSARLKSTWDWLLRAPVDWGGLSRWAAAVVLVLVAGVALAIHFHESWPAFYGLAINVAGITALAAKWAKKHLSVVSKGLDQMDAIRGKIDGAIAAKQSESQKEVAEAQRQHEAAMARLEKAEVHLREADAAIAQAEKAVQESRSISRMTKLLDERLSEKSYERYLGIVAAVRSDFQRLSELMKSLRADRGAKVDNLQPVDRIVLYIDDLDRCPSAQVVRVLEAIHLLLAFELFVVVVGVDIRWVAKSLADKYPKHLTAGSYQGGESGDPEEPGADGVSALDYLEKIFQIPFWLPPMEEDCSRNMIAEMVPRVVEAGGTAGVATPGRSEDGLQREDGLVTTGGTADKVVAAEAGANARSLVIEPEERSFMLQLAGAVGKSPRRLKRFVNTYRILKASLDNLQQETFVVKGGSQGEYRAAMTLLAIVTAAPRDSLGMLEFLANCGESADLRAFETKIALSPDRSEAKYAQAALQAYRAAEQGANLSLLRDWAPQVARFSFRSGRV